MLFPLLLFLSSDIIHRPQIQKLCLSSVAKIGIQSLDALSTLHKAGFVHGKVSADQVHLDGEGFNYKDYIDILHEIKLFDQEIAKLDHTKIGEYNQLKLILGMMVQQNKEDINKPFEWEVEIEEETRNEINKQKKQLKDRQNSLLSLINELKNPKLVSGSKDNQNKAVTNIRD
ncbi:MAG: hypothetical protein EZS28_014461 [Streblomastix strix]|uniref:Protein kinase domain-containing protein n=1 Tax=Streblomastix strix TaxID=222440 RepID=A0A5J4W4V6_9EUKA|nr:MAG: hypothetical protein EZS28_014461 [Streblomastix strix]